MKHKVNRIFTDKESSVLHMLDSFYVSNDYERIKELEKQGFIKANEDVESLKVIEKQVAKKPKPRKKKASEVDVRKD